MSKLFKRILAIAMAILTTAALVPIAAGADEAAAAAPPVLNLNELNTAGKTEVGLYTVYKEEHDVYHIEDGNSANVPGIHFDDKGKMAGMNNTSDIYLVLGSTSALVIDLSNKKEDGYTALHTIVTTLAGSRKILIAITHGHGDHTGQAAAFKDDKDITYLFPKNDWSDAQLKVFPAETVRFDGGYQIDLGGRVIDTVQVEGHTAGSIVFYDKAAKIGFSGDAVGSGSGIWLFNSFAMYKQGLENLLEVYDAVGDIKLYGGHAWQQNTANGYVALDRKYVEDMLAIVNNAAAGDFTVTPYTVMFDSTISFGAAMITCNRSNAAAYARSFGNLWDPFDDLDPSNPYYDAINYCLANNLYKGTSYTKFSPDAYVTRAQLAALFGRTEAAKVDHTKASAFSDVAVDAWSNGYITWAADQGIMKGYADGTFKPTEAVSQEDVNLAVRALLGDSIPDGALFDKPEGYATRAEIAGILMAIHTAE